ncbi:MAG TPA: TIGR03435 family protein [Bryobacteraceae bacterium]|nr:TIGR03435 family protein [Bryobacteraceae bacterium]
MGISVFCAVALLAQKPAAFEVTSVKVNRSGASQSRGVNISGPRIMGKNLPLRTLIQQAYGVLDFQIDGGPKWIDSERFDIQASTGRSTAIQLSELGPLLQELLADRFHLVTHRETKERQRYVLLVDKEGLKLQATRGTPAQSMSVANRKMIGEGVTMGALAYRIAVQPMFAGRTVVNKTGLSGFYDFTLEWEAGEDAEASLLRALREQLGLRLSSEKGPVEVLVIDRAEQPSEN